jgi:diaminohydroxyphosphoribosylaminopyrimidine deaminase/5-amino-6-(5-phosphoribosylamino)uracil reductase
MPTVAGRLDLRAVLERLAGLAVNELHVEAGPGLAGAFLSQHRLDELLLYVAPKILGPEARPLVELPGLTNLEQAPGFSLVDVQRVGEDLRLQLRPQ